MNGAALACLKAAGLGNLTNNLHAPRLTNYALACGGRSAQLSLPAGVAVSRATFDAALVNAAIAAGAIFRPNCRVDFAPAGQPDATNASRNDARILHIHTATGMETVAARVVLAAGGLGALASLQIAVDASPTPASNPKQGIAEAS
ncbi:MAG TPA: hypothetical protein VL860_13815, partial [Planctomycetota bacterium]|nr:hypothetical protein [Planctomycetota bacterium]